jgi:hypothetical protein
LDSDPKGGAFQKPVDGQAIMDAIYWAMGGMPIIILAPAEGEVLIYGVGTDSSKMKDKAENERNYCKP